MGFCTVPASVIPGSIIQNGNGVIFTVACPFGCRKARHTHGEPDGIEHVDGAVRESNCGGGTGGLYIVVLSETARSSYRGRDRRG